MTEREEMLRLADRLDAWAIPVSSGQGAALAMRDAATALRSAARTGPDVAGLREALNSATISCSRTEITIQCADHDVKDAIFDGLESIAALPAPAGESVTSWQPVKGYEGAYEVSHSGELRAKNGRILKLWKNQNGYLLARLSNLRSVARVHRLVADAFIPNPDGKPFVNHIDNDRSNNCVSNLEWCTQGENLAHARAQSRMQDNYWVGKRSPNACLSDEQVRSIRGMYSTGEWSLAKLGSEFEVSKRSIHRIVNRESYADV